MDIKVLGPGCPKCSQTEKVVREAITETGVEAQIEKVTDTMEIAGYGVSMVTLYYARRYVSFCLDLLTGSGLDEVRLNEEVREWFDAVGGCLRDTRAMLAADDIGDAFDWDVVPNPTGPGGSTGLPGGASIAAFKSTEHPEEVARVME